MKNIVSIHGAPRSGTSWLGQLFDSSPATIYKFQPLFSYAFKNKINPHSRNEEFKNFFKEVYNTSDNFLDQLDKKEKGYYPKFQKKVDQPDTLVMEMVRYHYLVPRLLEDFDNVKVVGIVRHPAAVMNSWRKAPREFLPEWNFQDQWYYGECKNLFRSEEWYGFQKWKELTSMFLKMEILYPSKFKLIHYENLVNNTQKVMNDLMDFASIPKNSQTQDFISQSKTVHHDDVYSVYKGNKDVNEWQSELPENIIDRIYKELKGTSLQRFL